MLYGIACVRRFSRSEDVSFEFIIQLLSYSRDLAFGFCFGNPLSLLPRPYPLKEGSGTQRTPKALN